MRILLWPFKLVWAMLGLLGRMLSAVFGIVLIIIGIILTVTIVGAGLGIPLLIIGILLLVRALF